MPTVTVSDHKITIDVLALCTFNISLMKWADCRLPGLNSNNYTDFVFGLRWKHRKHGRTKTAETFAA